MNQQPTFAKWSLEKLSDAFETVFVELAAALDAGTEGQISDERMTAMNLAWAETLAMAKWTFRQWEKALNREARYAV